MVEDLYANEESRCGLLLFYIPPHPTRRIDYVSWERKSFFLSAVGRAILPQLSAGSYFPAQHGARFPRKAAIPSCASAASAFIDITSLA